MARTFQLTLMVMMTVPLFGQSAVLTKMNKSKTRVVFSGPELEYAQIGDLIRIGSSCEVRITKKIKPTDKRVGASTESCGQTELLQIGASGAHVVVEDSMVNQTTLSSEARFRAGLPREHMMSGFGVGFIVGNVDKEGSVNESTRSGLGYETSRSLDAGKDSSVAGGLNVNYSFIPRQGIGVITDLNIGSSKNILSEDDYYFVRPALNFAFGFRDRFYLSGGVNYMYFVDSPKYTSGEFEGQVIDLKPSVGWQVGGGMVLKDHWQLNMAFIQSYQKIDQELERNQNAFNSALTASDRTSVAGNYDFTSVEMTLAYRF